MKTAFLALFIFFGSHSVGAIEVLDPHNVLRTLSNHLKPTATFKEAFTCGSFHEYSGDVTNCDFQCTDAICREKCYGVNTPTGRTQTKLFVENCSDTSVSVYGDNGWSLEVLKEDFDKGHGSMLIPVLKNMGHFIQPEGDIILSFAIPMGQYDYIHDGLKERLRGITIMATIESGTLQKPFFEIVLAATGKGLPQVLLIRSGTDEFLRLKGVFDVKY